MAFLSAAGSVTRLGIEKLVILPVLLPILGKETIGHFIVILSAIQLLGEFPIGGFGDAMLRLHAESKEQRRWLAVVNSSLWLTTGLSLATLLAGGIYFLLTPDKTSLLIYLWLGVYVVLLAARGILQNILRLDLKFEQIAIGEIIAGITLLAGIPAAKWFGLPGLSMGYALSSVLSLIAIYVLVQSRFRGQVLWDVVWAKKILRTAPAFILTAALGLGFYQLTRLALGAYHLPGGKITAFFAAESVIAIVLLPANYMGAVIYTLVARRQSLEEIPTSVLIQHLLGCIVCAGLVYLAVRICGFWLLTLFYRIVADEAFAVLQITSLGSMFSALLIFSRGFIFRFCSFSRIIAYSALGFLALAAGLVIGVPASGIIGAAWALAAANAFVGLLWFGTYVHLLFTSRRSPQIPVPPAVSSTVSDLS
jgi:O-antigen/teichoic acid export membrane protein